SGGFEAGDILVDSTSLSIASTTQLAADATAVAGLIALSAQDITASGRLHTTVSTAEGSGGLIQLTSCTMNVPNGGNLNSDGIGGQNLLQASGQMSIGGTLHSSSGENRL